MTSQKTSRVFAVILTSAVRTILYFPFWWYSRGFFNVLVGAGAWIKDFEQTLGLSIWIRNLFVPMFGQSDIQGRLISFFLRLFQIISKSVALFLFSIVVLVVILIWLLFPIVVIYQIFLHF